MHTVTVDRATRLAAVLLATGLLAAPTVRAQSAQVSVTLDDPTCPSMDALRPALTQAIRSAPASIETISIRIERDAAESPPRSLGTVAIDGRVHGAEAATCAGVIPRLLARLAPPTRSSPAEVDTGPPSLSASDAPPSANVHVRVESELARVWIYDFPDQGRYHASGHPEVRLVERQELLCEAPCELDLSRGTHLFGLAIRDRVPEANRLFDLQTPGTLRVRARRRTGRRVFGWIFSLVGAIGGPLVATAPLHLTPRDPRDSGLDAALGLGGSIGSVLFLAGGLALLLTSDPELRLEFVPSGLRARF